MSNYSVQSGCWDQFQAEAEMIRRKVFIEEQHIAESDEWDEQDAISIHFIVFHQDQPIATARLLQNNSIGRVAVLTDFRGKGVGLVIMQAIIAFAEQHNRLALKLSSQVHAISFYQRLGFTTQGSEYLDCGIPHIDMTLQLSPQE